MNHFGTKPVTLILVLVISISACENSRAKKVSSAAFVVDSVYQLNKAQAYDSVRSLIATHDMAYYPPENDSLTLVVIDTIFYNPKFDKLSFFAITANSNSKWGRGDSRKYRYDENCFTAFVTGNQLNNIRWFRAFRVSQFSDIDKTKQEMRELYFNVMKDQYDFGIGDAEFWTDSLIWNR